MRNLPHIKKPCSNCPFRKDSIKGWLGAEQMDDILDEPSFVCHKTIGSDLKQCAGHMLIKGRANDFVDMAHKMGVELNPSGGELVFDTEKDCIEHHR